MLLPRSIPQIGGLEAEVFFCVEPALGPVRAAEVPELLWRAAVSRPSPNEPLDSRGQDLSADYLLLILCSI